jgi:hypothetical protein
LISALTRRHAKVPAGLVNFVVVHAVRVAPFSVQS